jgi:hypothetical protein
MLQGASALCLRVKRQRVLLPHLSVSVGPRTNTGYYFVLYFHVTRIQMPGAVNNWFKRQEMAGEFVEFTDNSTQQRPLS